jgi:hypothetical protein
MQPAACKRHSAIPKLHGWEILSHRLPESYLSIIDIESEVEVLDFNMNLNMLERLLTEVEEVVVYIHARSLANSGLVHRHSNSVPKSDVSSPQLHILSRTLCKRRINPLYARLSPASHTSPAVSSSLSRIIMVRPRAASGQRQHRLLRHVSSLSSRKLPKNR